MRERERERERERKRKRESDVWGFQLAAYIIHMYPKKMNHMQSDPAIFGQWGGGAT